MNKSEARRKARAESSDLTDMRKESAGELIMKLYIDHNKTPKQIMDLINEERGPLEYWRIEGILLRMNSLFNAKKLSAFEYGMREYIEEGGEIKHDENIHQMIGEYLRDMTAKNKKKKKKRTKKNKKKTKKSAR